MLKITSLHNRRPQPKERPSQNPVDKERELDMRWEQALAKAKEKENDNKIEKKWRQLGRM